MKKSISIILAILLVMTFGFFAMGSGESETTDQGSNTADVIDQNNNSDDTADADNEKVESAKKENENDDELGDYSVEIDSCRLAKDFEGNYIVIVKYIFTNNSEDAANFMFAFNDTVYQDGIGLNECYFADDSANYSSDNQTKDIKTGSSLDVEVAYELNDNTTDIEVEVKELISFSDKTITKTFSIK